eukprot:2382049-Heterocapsa_arctica.AAC.1
MSLRTTGAAAATRTTGRLGAAEEDGAHGECLLQCAFDAAPRECRRLVLEDDVCVREHVLL